MTLPFNPLPIVAAALTYGWIKPASKTAPARSEPKHLANIRRYRARLYARGLTQYGTPRRNRRHPDLAHLHGKKYKRAYMKKYRARSNSPDPNSPDKP